MSSLESKAIFFFKSLEMNQSTTLTLPSSQIYCDLDLNRVLIFDTSAFSNQLAQYFSENDIEVRLISDFSEYTLALDAFEPELIFLDIDFLSNPETQMNFLKDKVRDAPVLLMIDSDTGRAGLMTRYLQLGFAGFLIRDSFPLSCINFLIRQSFEKKKLQDQNKSLKYSLEKAEKKLKTNHSQLDLELKSKSQFIERLSTNLERPLDQLVQFAHIALQRMQRKQFTQVGHYLAEVKMITEEIKTYIQDLREVALLKSGESRFHLEEIDMVDLLRTIKRQFQPIADSRDITLNLQNQVEHPFARGDFNKLSKVLNILLRNILKNLPKSSNLRIKTSSSNSFFEILIEDLSWILEEELTEQIFDVFNTQNFIDPKKMMSFNLSICKELMKGQKGDISIESEDSSKGVRFVLSIPLAGNFLDELTS